MSTSGSICVCVLLLAVAASRVQAEAQQAPPPPLEKPVMLPPVDCKLDTCQHVPSVDEMTETMKKEITEQQRKAQLQDAQGGGSDPVEPRRMTDLRVLYNWATPTFETNIAAFGVDVAEFNAKLARHVLHDYNHFVSQNKGQQKLESLENMESSPGLNNMFFEWQMQPENFNKLRWKNSPEYRQLIDIIYEALDYYLQTAGVDDRMIDQVIEQTDAEPWATVHSDFVSHGAHFHEGCIASAVYYVKVPKDAGVIELMDPRGPRPPFDNNRMIKPNTGDLIIFPSWLQHQVHPTLSNSTRISIPHNFAGKWRHTADVYKHVDISGKEWRASRTRQPEYKNMADRMKPRGQSGQGQGQGQDQQYRRQAPPRREREREQDPGMLQEEYDRYREGDEPFEGDRDPRGGGRRDPYEGGTDYGDDMFDFPAEEDGRGPPDDREQYGRGGRSMGGEGRSCDRRIP